MISMFLFFTCHILKEQLDAFTESDLTKNAPYLLIINDGISTNSFYH
jgi:hypothetical protein